MYSISAIHPSGRQISSHLFQAVRLKVGSSPLAVESNAELAAPAQSWRTGWTSKEGGYGAASRG